MTVSDWTRTYDQCHRDCGWFQPTDEATFDVIGADRDRMLQGFCTADIEKLAIGQGTEAFVLNPKGKILAYVRIFKLEDRLWVHCRRERCDSLIQHLDKYVIREDVGFERRDSNHATLIIAGPKAEKRVAEIPGVEPPAVPLGVVDISPNQGDEAQGDKAQAAALRIVRTNEFAVPAYRIESTSDHVADLVSQLDRDGVSRLPPPAVEALRLEAGTPVDITDVTSDNLPQEIQRDQQAISFTKGCYLGQETVARIDALGHVNRLLVSVEIEADAVQGAALNPAECDLLREGASVGQLTSIGFIPTRDCLMGLALVKRGNHESGTELQSSIGKTTVVDPHAS